MGLLESLLGAAMQTMAPGQGGGPEAVRSVQAVKAGS